MNSFEILKYRKQREAERRAEYLGEIILGNSWQRQIKEVFAAETPKSIKDDEDRFVSLYAAHARAAHLMIRGILEAEESDYLSPVTTEEHRSGNFRIRSRDINTPKLGDFVVEAVIWTHSRISSPSTRLSVDFIHPRVSTSRVPSRENIISSSLDDLTYEEIRYRNETHLPTISSRRETMAEICEQVGLATVPVAYKVMTRPKGL